MAVTTQPPGPTDPASSSAPESALSPLGVGVVVWLASELMFFAGLFAAYFSLRSLNSADWPPAGVELDTLRAALATVVLMASSVTMHMAVHTVQHREGPDDTRRSLLWLGATAALGAAFLVNLVGEYAGASFRIDDDSYGSIYYLMTGFHGLHVLGGLLFMAAVMWTLRGRTEVPVHATVEVCSYYWHFVDVVWLAMFLTIFVLR